jgi:hypothetical protein
MVSDMEKTGRRISLVTSFGQGVGDADVEPEHLGPGCLSDGIGELAAEGEDLLGVAKGDLAGIGEDIPAAFALEELHAKGELELVDLLGDGWLRDMQRRGSAGKAAFLWQPSRSSAGDDSSASPSVTEGRLFGQTYESIRNCILVRVEERERMMGTVKSFKLHSDLG